MMPQAKIHNTIMEIKGQFLYRFSLQGIALAEAPRREGDPGLKNRTGERGVRV